MLYKINQKFDLLFSKKAFVHWYLKDGMEEMEFSQAKEKSADCVYLYGPVGV